MVLDSVGLMFDQRFCYKPRKLKTYVNPPRRKRPPNWQIAQQVVKALIIERIGAAPYYSMHHISEVKRYQKQYSKLRAEYWEEDFPINL